MVLVETRKLVVACWLGVGGAVLAYPAQEPLTLDEAVRRALANNPELATDAPALESARIEISAAGAGYFPTLDLEQSYSGGNNPVYVFGTLLSQRRFTAANFNLPLLNRPDALDNLQTRVVARHTLWDFGRTRLQVESARTGAEVAERGHESHVDRVILSALDAYLYVSLARENLDAARSALESAEAIVNQARSRVGAGVAVEADLLRSSVHLASARQMNIQARGQLEIAKAQLNRIMGEPLESAQGETAALTPVTLTLPEESVLLAGLPQRRPDFQRLLAEVRQAELEVRLLRAEFLPVLGSFVAWEADNPSLSSAGGNNWTAALSLRWNVFAGGRDTARLAAARQRLEIKRKERAAMESSMALEIRKALIRCRAAEQQVEVAAAAQSQSEESLRILRNRYDSGLATMTDLLAAESSRAEARAAFAEALYRHRISFAQLEFSAGLMSPTSRAVRP